MRYTCIALAYGLILMIKILENIEKQLFFSAIERAMASICSDGEKLPTEASSELRKRLQRVQVFTEGDHTPSDGRLGPSEITHKLLLAARDIVSNGAPPVAGNSQLRLLA